MPDPGNEEADMEQREHIMCAEQDRTNYCDYHRRGSLNSDYQQQREFLEPKLRQRRSVDHIDENT